MYLLFFIIINRKNALKLGLSAALVLAIRSIWVTTIGCGYWTGLSWIVSRVEHDYLYMAAPLILAAIVVQYTTEEHSTKIQPAKANTEKTSPTDRIGELTKLKELLDMGAITQTEFDEKKKEMLNL